MHLIGLISDTHGLLRPEALAALAGVERIIHAGDVGGPEIIAALAELAPVTAVRGNTDTSPWGRTLPRTAELAVGQARLLIIHNLAELSPPAADAGYHAVISGHTHRALVRPYGAALGINPGAAGHRRFSLPVTVALLRVDGAGLDVDVVELDVGR